MVRGLKVAAGKFLLRPLNAIFGAPGHIALLRALLGGSDGLTGRQVARSAGMAHGAAMQGLTRLEEAKVVKKRPVGRAFVFQLDRDHHLVRDGIIPLLEKEAEIRGRVFEGLRTAFERKVLSGYVYGSVARGEDVPESDLDVCLIVERPEEKERVRKEGERIFQRLSRELGLIVSPLIYTRREFTQGYRSRNQFFQNIVREGERFVGRSLPEVIRAEKDQKDRR